MEGPPLGPGGEDITWPDQVAPRGRKASSTRKIKPQTSNLLCTQDKLRQVQKVRGVPLSEIAGVLPGTREVRGVDQSAALLARVQAFWLRWERDVPFMNRPLESEIHGTVNFTYFCCVLLVTWCYRVLLSCYLRPK